MQFLFVVHPGARNTAWLKELVDSLQAAWEETRSLEHARDLGREAATQGRVAVAVGGDGTIHAVMNGVLSSRADNPCMSAIPAGSGNDIARSLGLRWQRSRADLSRWHGRKLDVGVVSCGEIQRHFLSSATIGVSAQTTVWVEKFKPYCPRFLLYPLAAARALASWTSFSGQVWIGSEALPIGKFLNVNLANLRYYGGGMYASPQACGDDGWLDLAIMDMSLLAAVANFPETYRGRFERCPGMSQRRFQRLRIESQRPLPVQADGEWLGEFTAFDCWIQPAALTFLLPSA